MAITKASLIDLNGQELILDADADTSITADTDDILDFKTGGTDRLKISGNNLHLNGGTDARIQLGSGGAGANSTSNDTVHIRGDGDDMKLMAAADGNYIFENNGSEVVRIDSGGNVGIGTTSPGHPLHIVESADGTKLRLTRGGVCEWDFSIGNTSTLSGVGSGALELLPQNSNTANEFAIGQAGTTTALFHLTNADCTFGGNVKIKGADLHFPNGLTGASSANSDVRYNTSSGQVYYQTSSRRYKKDITDLEIDTTKIYELDTVSFTDKTTEDRCFGLIAEEVDKVIPELVNKRVIEGLGDDPVPDTISYSMLSVLLLKELQSTKIKLDDALERIQTLEDA